MENTKQKKEKKTVDSLMRKHGIAYTVAANGAYSIDMGQDNFEAFKKDIEKLDFSKKKH